MAAAASRLPVHGMTVDRLLFATDDIVPSFGRCYYEIFVAILSLPVTITHAT
jgi:hypothetical protein